MEFDRYITPDGETYEFDNQVDLFLMSRSGSGLPPLRPITLDLPQIHGKKRVGYRLEPRVISLVHHRIAGYTRANFYSARGSLLDHLRPNRSLAESPGRLRKIFEDGTMLDIEVYVTGGLTLDEGEHLEEGRYNVRDVIEFTAYNPSYYNPVLLTELLSIQGVNELVFPISFPITFSGAIVEANATIAYAGTWESSPTIVISGPVQSPRITNETTGKTIILNYNVASGEAITIITDPLSLSVISSTIGSISGSTGDSDLIDFVLVPGDNDIAALGGAKFEAAEFSIQYYERYIGY